MLRKTEGRRGRGWQRRRDGWIATPMQWIWVWANSGKWWRTVKPGVLQVMKLQRVGHDWAIEQQQQMFTAALFTIAKICKQPMSTDQWMDKEVVHIHNGISLSHKNRNPAVCNNKNGTWGYYAKWNVRQRNTNTVWTHMWNLKEKKKLIVREIRLVVIRGVGGGNGLRWSKLPVMRQRSTGNIVITWWLQLALLYFGIFESCSESKF